ncbi:MAG TPA: NAD(P)-binding domain-containing protein [Flavisolibacter sp.]|nr:NAD(P)-binding domain-containing protein [Flavisolibacter sp.]
MVKTAVAIIGATGKMGSAIAKALTKGPYRLLLFARNQQKLLQLNDEIRRMTPSADVDCLGCSTDACWEADVIIPAVPRSAQKEVAQKISEVATQKVVVNITKHDSDSNSAAEELQQWLPLAKVVTAFNTISPADFLPVTGSSQPADVLITGNDSEAINVVKGLVKAAGFNPVYAGDLSRSGTLEAVPFAD